MPGTRWGAQIAPNSMGQIIGAPMLGHPMPADVKAATKGVFRGIHVFVSGGSTEFYRPIYPATGSTPTTAKSRLRSSSRSSQAARSSRCAAT